jgi:UDP-GlcNAc:undecaprenyl-phosphate GlcNAc-1-phosphate transferase
MAALALALRFVPYSDDRGNFDTFWTVVMAAILALAVAASFYVIYVLEILKLRRFRFRQAAARGPEPPPEVVDREVERELETGQFRTVDPDTGEFEETGTKT